MAVMKDLRREIHVPVARAARGSGIPGTVEVMAGCAGLLPQTLDMVRMGEMHRSGWISEEEDILAPCALDGR